MEEQKKVITDKIHLIRAKTIAGFLNHAEDIEDDEIKGFTSSFNFTTAYSIESKRIKNTLSIEIKAQGEENGSLELEAGYTVEFIFEIENLEELSEKQDDGTIKISIHLAATLAGICYSTLRGIVLTRTQGTPLNGMIMPIIDPYTLLKN
jgi:hypothetical protein